MIISMVNKELKKIQAPGLLWQSVLQNNIETHMYKIILYGPLSEVYIGA